MIIIPSSVWVIVLRAIGHGFRWLWRAMVTGDHAQYVVRVTVFIILILVFGLGVWEYFINDRVSVIPTMVARRDAELADMKRRDDAQDAARERSDRAINESAELIVKLSKEVTQFALATSKLDGKVNVLSQDMTILQGEVFRRSWPTLSAPPPSRRENK